MAIAMVVRRLTSSVSTNMQELRNECNNYFCSEFPRDEGV
jgi:hypothetical protein